MRRDSVSLLTLVSLIFTAMGLIFGERLVDFFHLSEDTIQAILLVVLFSVAGVVLVFFLKDAAASTIISGGLNTFIRIVVLIGFAFDVITSIVGAEIMFSGGGPAIVSGSLVWLSPAQTTLTSAAGGFLFTALLFAVTLSFEAGFSGKYFPSWAYVPIFGIAALFDVITSSYGFYRLFGATSPFSLQTVLFVVAAIFVCVCQFAFIKLFQGAVFVGEPLGTVPPDGADGAPSDETPSPSNGSGPVASVEAAPTVTPNAPQATNPNSV